MTSTLFLGLASIVLALVFRAQSGTFPPVAQRLPALLIWIVIGLAVMMIAEEIYKRRKARQGKIVSADEPMPPINWPTMLLFGAGIVAYVALIPLLGYAVATPIFIAGTLLAGRNMRTRTALLVAAGISAFLCIVFVWALSLPVKLLPFAL